MDLNRLSKESINIESLDNKDLIGYHSLIHYWGETEKYTKDELCPIHLAIVKEMKKRNLRHIRKLTFEDEKPDVPRPDGKIHMTAPHGSLVWDEFKKLIVKSQKYDVVGKHLYLMEEDRCYGIVKITTVEKMDITQFKEFEYLHHVSDVERKRWWPNVKEFWGYQFEIVDKYSPPKKTNELKRTLEGLPFAGYPDFDACVRSVIAKKKWDKKRASAYCGSIKRKVEKKSKEMFDDFTNILLKDLTKLLTMQEKQSILVESAIQEEMGKKFKMPYEFNFIALKEGEFNGVWYSKDELLKSYHTLKDKNLTIDHGKSVMDVVGKIKNVWWNEDLEQIEGTAEVSEDGDLANKIHNKLITGVSVEVYVDKEEEKDRVVAKDPNFVALSIVTVPACRTCRIVEK